jgi:hypothetical protein
MDESRRHVITFIEKEIKTYLALSLFLSNKGIKQHARAVAKKVPISPSYYKERMKEAEKLVCELRKPN